MTWKFVDIDEILTLIQHVESVGITEQNWFYRVNPKSSLLQR